jgi:3-deoxy-D-manno-octulosonic-acid transferase
VLAGLIRAIKATSKTVYEPCTFFDELRANVPFILAMWHGQFMMLADLNTREFDVAAMVSRHGDAEVIARVLKHFGISAIRGAGAGERRANRGGAYALRTALRALNSRSIVAMTADVPPTKPRCAGPGIVALARLSGRPIIPIAAATSRFIEFNTWSRLTVNLPFSTLALVAGAPLFVPFDADGAVLERARQQVEGSLNEVTNRAYELAKSGSRHADSLEAHATRREYR